LKNAFDYFAVGHKLDKIVTWFDRIKLNEHATGQRIVHDEKLFTALRPYSLHEYKRNRRIDSEIG